MKSLKWLAAHEALLSLAAEHLRIKDKFPMQTLLLSVQHFKAPCKVQNRKYKMQWGEMQEDMMMFKISFVAGKGHWITPSATVHRSRLGQRKSSSYRKSGELDYGMAGDTQVWHPLLQSHAALCSPYRYGGIPVIQP